jgi:hypothetical protein
MENGTDLCSQNLRNFTLTKELMGRKEELENSGVGVAIS